MIYIIVILSIFLSLIGVLAFIFINSTSIIRGAYKVYNIVLEKGSSIYFNAKHGISRVGINGIEIKNPFKELFPDKKQEGDFHLLLLNRPSPISSSSKYFHGPYTLRITGYSGGSLSINLTDTPNQFEKLEIHVYGENIFDRSDSLYRFLPCQFKNKTQTYSITGDGIMNGELFKSSSHKIPFSSKVYEHSSGAYLWISASYDKIGLTVNSKELTMIEELPHNLNQSPEVH